MFISIDQILLTLLRLHPEKYRKNSRDQLFGSVSSGSLESSNSMVQENFFSGGTARRLHCIPIDSITREPF